MKKGFAPPIIIIAVILPVIVLLAWAPWVTDDFALSKLRTYNPCPQLAVVPDFKTPSSSQKMPFGRKLIKTESACGTYDLFVSALGTVHQIKFYKLSESKAPNATVYPEASQSVSSPIAQLVKKDLSDLLKIPENSVEVLSVEKAEWMDSCLGVDTGELCAQVITPGYKISLRGTGNRIYIYHTDLNKNFILERPTRGNL